MVLRKVGKYEIGRTIGEGTFAKVKFAQNTETGESVAMKVLDRSAIIKHKMADQVLLFTIIRFIQLPLNFLFFIFFRVLEKKLISKDTFFWSVSVNLGEQESDKNSSFSFVVKILQVSGFSKKIQTYIFLLQTQL